MVESGEQRQRTYGQWWDSTEEQVIVTLDAVRQIALAGLQSAGATAEDAAFLLDIALDKAIQGDPVRGMVSVPRWVHAARQGDLDLRPQIQVLRETGATAIVDGGPKAEPALVCRYAIDLAIEKARLHGVGWVTARAHGEILTPIHEAGCHPGHGGHGDDPELPIRCPNRRDGAVPGQRSDWLCHTGRTARSGYPGYVSYPDICHTCG